MIITIDGPEKAGKTTLINAIREIRNGTTVVHWGPVEPDDRVYLKPLKQAAASDQWVIWDRCWPSEHVYGKMLHRDRRLAVDPWLGEWLYGRAVQTAGVKIILLPDHSEQLKRLRDSSDLPVDPEVETGMYENYAKSFQWKVLHNNYTSTGLQANYDRILKLMIPVEYQLTKPPKYAGDLLAEIVFVGESLKLGSDLKPAGAWLPFTTYLTSLYGRHLGNEAFKCGWTNIDSSITIENLADTSLIACGKKAEAWCENVQQSVRRVKVVALPHPAWLYRYNNAETTKKRIETDAILQNLKETLK